MSAFGGTDFELTVRYGHLFLRPGPELGTITEDPSGR